MEQITLLLIIITNVFLVLILGFLSFIVYRMIKQQKVSKEVELISKDNNSPSYHPEVMERIREIEKVKQRRADLFCPNHPDEPGETVCAICDKLYCKSCIKPFKSLHFCKNHIPLIMKHDWDEIITIKTSTSNPEEGVRLYEFKQLLLQKDNLPTYIETHYKINVDQDHIETYLVLFGIRENKDLLKFKLIEFGPAIENPH